MSPSQTAITQWGWRFHTLWGGIDAGDLPLSLGCWSCRGMEGFLTRGWEFILSGCGGTAALARGATLAARWLHEPQSISNHPVGLGFPHPAGRHQPGRSAFSSPGCCSCRDMEGFLSRGWEVILPGCGGTAALARGATLAARWLQLSSNTAQPPVFNHGVVVR